MPAIGAGTDKGKPIARIVRVSVKLKRAAADFRQRLVEHVGSRTLERILDVPEDVLNDQ